MIYSGEFYITDNGNGYSLNVRDAICSGCHRVIDRQKKYRSISKEFEFSDTDKNEWKFCPYCGTSLEK